MNRNLTTRFNDVLKENGLSSTKTRLHIFELLQDKEPQSMHELFLRGKAKFDRVTLYRTIKLFEEVHIAQRVYSGWKYKLELTDRFSSHHHHLTCLKCGNIIPIKEDSEVEALIANLASQNDFKVLNHQLELQGVCKNCQ
jgi:Fur family ferric uptake transcriptional regulator